LQEAKRKFSPIGTLQTRAERDSVKEKPPNSTQKKKKKIPNKKKPRSIENTGKEPHNLV
jgi:hypothetical protein